MTSSQNKTSVAIALLFLSFIMAACAPNRPVEQFVEDPVTIQQEATSPLPSAQPESPQRQPAALRKEFSINSSSKIQPQDVLKEVYYPLGGGGVSCAGLNQEVLTVVNRESFPEGEAFEWLSPIPIFVCGWHNRQSVTVTAHLPNGEEVIDHVETTDDYIDQILWYVYYPKSSSPVGVYEFAFSGEEGTISYSVNVVLPREPRMYYISPHQALMMYGYRSNENVRLFYYRGQEDLMFDSWETYQVDVNGELIVELEPSLLSRGEVISIGDVSGLVNRSGEAFADHYPRRPNILLNSTDTVPSVCPSNLPSRLEIDDYAYVIALNPPLPNRLRNTPSLSGNRIGEINAGGVVNLVDGPVCSDNIVWWKVEVIGSNLSGWTAEGDSEYFLQKCASQNSCP